MTQQLHRSAKDVAYEYVKGQIIGPHLQEGVFLTEGQVAMALGISRTPVREAFLRLEAESLLTLVPQKGAFIPPISDREVQEVMETRKVLEVYCGQRVARAGIDLSRPLSTLLREQEQRSDDVEDFIDCDRRFHHHIVSTAGNRLLTKLYESLRDRQLRMGIKAVVGDRGRAHQVIDEHRTIAEALESGDEGLVRRALEAHLDATLATLRRERGPR
ncbi:MAG: GntR family transcriptional regulator [Actinomycetota bacterium]|nr:GntR family transcriptional regulator [Actinomycetota bacterium]